MKKSLIALITAAAIISGCGSGGGSDGDSSSTADSYNVTIGTGTTGQNFTYDCGGARVDNFTVYGTYNIIEISNCNVVKLIYNATDSAIGMTNGTDMQQIQCNGTGANYVYASQIILDRIPDACGFVKTEI